MSKSRTEMRALITGITGQDGVYLAELLLGKGYEVHGLYRRIAYRPITRLERLLQLYPDRLKLHVGDLLDGAALIHLLLKVQPDEIYNLAAQSDVAVSFEVPEYTLQVNTIGTLRLLEALRITGLIASVRMYHASSSEMFGKVAEIPQTESTPFYPRSPYGVAKLSAHWLCVNYREAYSLFVCNGILFNHESPCRGAQFVTQKIAQGIVQYAMQCNDGPLVLGNLSAQRDWGYAPEYVEVMWRMLQHSRADDYVVATGKTTTVREFVDMAAAAAGVSLEWEGVGLNERARDATTGDIVVMVSEEFFRPTEVDILLGDSTKAATVLGWTPQTTVAQLAEIMVHSAQQELEEGELLVCDEHEGMLWK